ncbi:MAG: hemin uptake protein HemP [bacterium]
MAAEGTEEGLPVPRQVKSEDLFLPDESELWILHGTQSYRLRKTKNGKLILTK